MHNVLECKDVIKNDENKQIHINPNVIILDEEKAATCEPKLVFSCTPLVVEGSLHDPGLNVGPKYFDYDSIDVCQSVLDKIYIVPGNQTQKKVRMIEL